MNKPIDVAESEVRCVFTSESHTPYEFVLPNPERNKERHEVRAAWQELSGFVEGYVREQGSEFIAMCNELGIFESLSGCDVDLLDDGHLIFDWNDGERPILTVVVRLDRQVVYSGRFKSGDVSGRDTHVRSIRAVLQRLMDESGRTACITVASQGSLTNVGGEDPASRGELSFTHQRTKADYLFSRQTMQPATT